MENKKTPCECPLAGFCNRHGIVKTTHYHKLCQNHIGYFDMWEKCRGPGQNKIDCSDAQPVKSVCQFCNGQKCNGQCRDNQNLPSKTEMASNLIKATKEHAKTGFAKVDNDEQQKRLEICQGCEFYIPSQDRCSKCGCYLKSKSAWKSSKCPIGKW